MIERRKEIEALVGKEAVQERILYACSNTAQKAADFKTESLLEEAQKAMRANYPEGARQFILESNLEYYLARREDQNYLKAAQDYRRKGNADDQELFRISQDLLNFFSDNSKCLKAAEKFAAAACTDTDQYQILLHYATILNDTGKREKAIDIAKQALELAEPAGRGATMQVEYFLQQLEG